MQKYTIIRNKTIVKARMKIVQKGANEIVVLCWKTVLKAFKIPCKYIFCGDFSLKLF